MAGAYVFLALRDAPFAPDVQFTVDEDVSIDQLVEAFREFLLGCGYAPESVEGVSFMLRHERKAVD